MTIEECKARKRAYKQMLKNIDVLKLSLIRSIATEDMNIATLRNKIKEEKNGI